MICHLKRPIAEVAILPCCCHANKPPPQPTSSRKVANVDPLWIHSTFILRTRTLRDVVNDCTTGMESLLSVSFDNISSRDSGKIRKGLRQIEGLLAQICLSKPKSQSPHKRKSSVLSDKQQCSPKKLSELKDDPAFREFFRLQEGFQCNGMASV